MTKGFTKRRTKLGDAELRHIAGRRNDEVSEINTEFQQELDKFNELSRNAVASNEGDAQKLKEVKDTLGKAEGRF